VREAGGAAASPPRQPLGPTALLVAAWALGGVTLLFMQAIVRLGARGLDTVAAGLAPLEWGVLLVLTAAFVYGEGVRGIQRGFAPVATRRLLDLLERRRGPRDVLAPLYMLGLVGTPARRVLRAWLGVTAIVIAVLIVREFPEPWRGIVDCAVVAALLWGLGAILVRSLASLRGTT
jgi:hypothetical protein